MANSKLTEEQLAKRRRIKKAKRKRAIITSILILLILVATSFAVYFYFLYKKEAKSNLENIQLAQTSQAESQAAKDSYEQLQTDLQNGGFITIGEANEQADTAVEDKLAEIRAYFENGDGTLTMLENTYPDNIVVPDKKGYHFFDIEESLVKSPLDYSKFEYPVLDEETDKYVGEATYDDGSITAKKGVDVSKFQGDVDWEKVKNDGIEFAYIRLGYRGYESGKIVVDEKYEDNIAGCNEVGLDCGVYFFTEAKTAAEAVEEAEFVLENLGEYHVELPIVIDVEESANTTKTRTKNVTAEERTKCVIAFCERIKEAGYTPMIYGNLKSLMLMTDIHELEEYDRWFAYYHYPIRFPYKYRIWQYTASGTVDGISGSADVNLMFY